MGQFETDALNYVLSTCKKHILYSFDTNDKRNKKINFVNEIFEITVYKEHFSNTCFEQFRVYFAGIFHNKILTSSFYLEWKDNIIGSELLPANTHWDPKTNTFSNRSIKIRYVERV